MTFTLLLLACLATLPSCTHGLLSPNDTAVLKYMHDNINGIQNLPGWSAGDPTTMCNWTGVSCNAINGTGYDYVTYIRLDNKNLGGPVPQPLGGLQYLEILELSTNSFNGTIPSSLGNLVNLKDLSLSGNQLLGPVPVSLGNLTNLQELLLFNNQLNGSLPNSMLKMADLQYLHLYNNDLSGEIPDLDLLPNLRSCKLEHNQFTCSHSVKCQSGFPICPNVTVVENS